MNQIESKTGTLVRTATDVAKPAVQSSIDFLKNSDPTQIAYYVIGALGIYLFGPTLLATVWSSFKGYAGDISPAGALDALMNSSNAFLIDIRTSVRF